MGWFFGCFGIGLAGEFAAVLPEFEVDGVGRIVGLAHTAFVEFREKSGRDLTDREASFIAAEYLRERLEEEDERPLYDVPHEEVMRLIKMIGIK